jgi:hypothetical protein
MSLIHKPPRYRTLLLTLWEERNEDLDVPSAWRFRLEDPRTGQRQGFSSLQALMSMLEQEIGTHQHQKTDDTTKGGSQGVSKR